MNWSTLIMYGVAGAFGALGLAVITRAASSEAAIYRRRIAGTMLLVLSLILATFATTYRFATT